MQPVAMVVVAAQLVTWSISVSFSCGVTVLLVATGSAAPLVVVGLLVRVERDGGALRLALARDRVCQWCTALLLVVVFLGKQL